MTRRWSAVLALVFLARLTAVAHAQVEQGTITGKVEDAAGGVVPGATVKVAQMETGVVRETLTNGSGLYTVPPFSRWGPTRSRQPCPDSRRRA